MIMSAQNARMIMIVKNSIFAKRMIANMAAGLQMNVGKVVFVIQLRDALLISMSNLN